MKKKLAFLVVASIVGILISGINPLQLYAITYPTGKIGVNYSLYCSLAQWNYRKQIIINSSLVESSLLDFPILVYKSSDDDLATRAASDGSDIIFVSSSVEWSTGLPDDRLAHEIEKYDSDTGEIVAWVKIPFLSSTTDTVIYMYYNNSSPVCTDTNWQNVTGVWNSNFHGVWHFNQSAGTINDSTSFENHGTAYNNPTYNVEGKIAGAMQFDGSNDYVSCGDPTDGSLDFGTGNFTIEFWVKTTTTENRYIIGKMNPLISPTYGYTLQISSSKLLVEIASVDVYNFTEGAESINDGTWRHLAVVFNGTDDVCFYYVDGELDLEVNEDGIGDIGTSSPFEFCRKLYELGRYTYFAGTLDEARISNTIRNASWINTTYVTIAMPGSFLSFGEENTDTQYSSSSDGYIYVAAGGMSGYKDVHDAASGTVVDTSENIYIGQTYNGMSGVYTIYRGFVFFDTSALPDNAIITEATLSVYGYQDFSTGSDFSLTIQNGQPDYPNDPLKGSDYNYQNYQGDGGSLSTSDYKTTVYNDISLNSTGLSWINTTGVTKLCLRSSRDIGENSPTFGGPNEYVIVYASEKGRGYEPKLTITYILPWSESGFRVYRGDIEVDAADTVIYEPIGGTVRLSKAFLVSYIAGTGVPSTPSKGGISGYIYNTTHLRFERLTAEEGVNVSWFVVESLGGEFIVRARNQITLGLLHLSNTATISGIVDVDQCMVVGNFRSDADANTEWDSYTTRLEITNANTVTAERYTTDAHTTYVRYEVMEWASDYSVYTGTFEMDDTINTQLISGSGNSDDPVINTSRSILFATWEQPHEGLQCAGLNYRITNTNEVEFGHYSATYTKTITWYVVEFPAAQSPTIQTWYYEWDPGLEPDNVKNNTMNAIDLNHTFMTFGTSVSGTATLYMRAYNLPRILNETTWSETQYYPGAATPDKHWTTASVIELPYDDGTSYRWIH